MLGTLYVVGLLIVNIEMANYGLFSMGLARAEYILVGTTWAALAAFNGSMTLQGLSVLLQGQEHGAILGTLKAWTRAAWALVLVLFAPVSTLGAIYFVNQWITGPSSAVARVDWWLFAVQMVALEANVGLLVVAYRGLASLSGGMAVSVPSVPTPAASPPPAQPLAPAPEPDAAPVSRMLPSSWSKLGEYGYGTFHFTIWLILALWLYTAAVFPLIPQALGGGQRSLVTLLLKESPGLDLKSLGLPAVAEKSLLGPVSMLVETDTMYFVVGPRQDRAPGLWHLSHRGARAVGLEKKLVVAVVPVVEERERHARP
jgi:hypothetical protein